MSEDEIIGIIKQTLDEHSKGLVSKVECGNKLWGFLKVLLSVTLPVLGAMVGFLVAIKVDISRIDTIQKSNTLKIEALSNSWKSIDYKLDVLLGKSPKLTDYQK